MVAIHKLRHAVVLTELGSFRRAADALNLTQPALSRSIQSLEKTLGVRLFDRSHGGVEATAFGKVVVDRGREILLGVAELEHEVELMQGLGVGTLEVSLAPYPSALSGQLAVARLLADHPDVQCRVRVAGYSTIADDVATGRCEVGIADLSVAPGDAFASERLVNRPIYFFARPRHPLAARKHCALEDALLYPWAGIRAPARVSTHLPADVHRAGHWDRETGQFVPALEVDIVSEFKVLARESDILVAATLTMVEEELATGELAIVRFSQPWLRLGYGFIFRHNRTLSPASLRFMKIVREIETDLEKREIALRKRYL